MAPLLEGFRVPDTLPAKRATPPPLKQKVVGSVGKIPVNRQAAMIIAPNRDWSTQPVHGENDLTNKERVAECKNALRIERNQHAETKARLGAARAEIRFLRGKLFGAEKEIESWKASFKRVDEKQQQELAIKNALLSRLIE